MFSFLNNIPTVTRNLLIMNILMFILTYIITMNGGDWDVRLAVHSVNSSLFEPYQIVSHFFMHGDPLHLFMNMFGLVMFGGFLERLWGNKRFFIFFFSACIGAWAFTAVIDYIEIVNLESSLKALGLKDVDLMMYKSQVINDPRHYYSLGDGTILDNTKIAYQKALLKGSVGASGGVFAILAAFAILFPNTELMLLFFPVPIKAKYLIGVYVLYEIYQIFYPSANDHINHLAHIGGAIVGAIFVLVWRRNRNQFY